MTTLPIVGARFRPPAQDILDNMVAGDKMTLRRQPDNPYDVNAIAVVGDADNEAGYVEEFHLGFIPRTDAAHIAPILDSQSLTEIPATYGFTMQGAPAVVFEVPAKQSAAEQQTELDKNAADRTQ